MIALAKMLAHNYFQYISTIGKCTTNVPLKGIKLVFFSLETFKLKQTIKTNPNLVVVNILYGLSKDSMQEPYLPTRNFR